MMSMSNHESWKQKQACLISGNPVNQATKQAQRHDEATSISTKLQVYIDLPNNKRQREWHLILPFFVYVTFKINLKTVISFKIDHLINPLRYYVMIEIWPKKLGT